MDYLLIKTDLEIDEQVTLKIQTKNPLMRVF
jgi:hypothetical protein